MEKIALIAFLSGIAAVHGQKVVKIDSREITDAHNRVRRLERASNMQEMGLAAMHHRMELQVWSDVLARKAEAFASHCQFRHSAHHLRDNAAGFDYIGENLNAFGTTNAYFDPQAYDVTRVIEKNWSQNEKKHFNLHTGKCKPSKKCGHYTQIVWATTCSVGCALVECGRQIFPFYPKSLIFACWYGPGGNRHAITWSRNGPIVKRTQPFLPGRPCSKCPGDGRCRKGLCDASASDSQCSRRTPKMPWEQPRTAKKKMRPSRVYTMRTTKRPRQMKRRGKRCVYGPWRRWNKCSVSCGWGERQRTRGLLRGNLGACKRTKKQTIPCHVRHCRGSPHRLG